MLDSIYVGMSGLVNFSKGLTNISNNVANMNTPGFKGSALEFLDLFYRYSYSGSGDQQQTAYSQGSGVRAGATTIQFAQGQFSQTGNDLDAAIDGSGFFVVQKDGKTFYTRDGQFTIDDAGFLVTQSDGSRVMGQSGGALVDISIAGKRSNSPQATTEIKLTNSLSTGDSTFDVSNISVFDSLGVKHQMTLHMVNNNATTPGSWTYTLLENSTTVGSGEVQYSGSGTPVAGFETSVINFDPKNGATPTKITLDFSGSNAFSSSGSSLSVSSSDGFAAGFITKIAIDESGNLVLSYSNGQTSHDQRLALALFENMTALQSEGSNRYSIFGNTRRLIASPGDQSAGKLKPGNIELSNVDLAQQFSNLIIIQRGYQASSQIISAANEMLQQLGDLQGKR